MPNRKLWPVTFRPKRGEVLYSWIARIAAVYRVSPRDLLPGAHNIYYPSTLVQSGDQNVLRGSSHIQPKTSVKEYRFACCNRLRPQSHLMPPHGNTRL